MHIPPQISAASIVAVGNFNPLIFRTDWLKEKELIVGNDFDNLKTSIVHAEVVSYQIPWGTFQTDRESFSIAALREPLVRAQGFFVRCFQSLPETPIKAVGINREIHFETAGQSVRDRVGDVLAPKEPWGDFIETNGRRTGGLRALAMEQSIIREGRMTRSDGRFGHIQVRVEPSLRPDIRYGIFVAVNDHFDLMTTPEKPSDGRSVADLVAQTFDSSIAHSEHLIDRIMRLTDPPRARATRGRDYSPPNRRWRA
jgi:hypothetical protein